MDRDESRPGLTKAIAIAALVVAGWVLHSMGVGPVLPFYIVLAGAAIGLTCEFKDGMDAEEIRKLVKKWAIIASFFVAAVVFYVLEWSMMLKLYVVIVTLLSVGAILLQSGRGGGLSASFGGAGGDSLLGARSATPIAKATYVMLALFIFISALIAQLYARETSPVDPAEGAPTEPAPGDAPLAEPSDLPGD
jgi:preprotein translocase subunit SecG